MLAIIGARFAVTAVDFPAGDGDLAWQRWLGRTILRTHRIPRALGAESFAAVGSHWTPQEWAFGIGAALGTAGLPWTIFALCVAGCAILALVLVAYRAVRRQANPVAVAIVVAATALAMFESFGVRAQVVAWPMLALLLLTLDNEGPWLWAAVPVAALWSNLHASAMLAPLLAGATAVGRLSEDRAWTPRVKRTFAVTVATVLAICCNPFGIGLPEYALSLFASPIKGYISEWEPTNVSMLSFALGALPLLLAAVGLGVVTRRFRADALVFAAFTFLLFFAARNIAIFSIATAPLVAVAATRAFDLATQSDEPEHLRWIGRYAIPAFAMVLAVVVGIGLYRSQERTEVTMPYKEIAALSSMPGDHRIFCADFAWCSFFIGIPHQSVFLDGRADPYPVSVWKDFATIAFLQQHWRERLAAQRINALIAERGKPLDQALRLIGWRQVTQDKKFRLWVLPDQTLDSRTAGVRLPNGG
ncbi:MAG TPA: hypothetical protein VME66_14080 [Candidatus Acidoferrales bacterium]|nr:hypothetical protein [Candidatus Acidoferrales bacterium]